MTNHEHNAECKTLEFIVARQSVFAQNAAETLRDLAGDLNKAAANTEARLRGEQTHTYTHANDGLRDKLAHALNWLGRAEELEVVIRHLGKNVRPV